jgi:membrane protein YqaA with SNARE-associated domain
VTSLLTLFGISLLGTVVWVVSPEAAAALYASQRVWHPLVIGLVVACGQAVTQAALFAFGDLLRRRWPRFDRQCERVRLRFGRTLQRGSALLASSSGLLGLPPVSAVAALAPGLGLRAVQVLPPIFVMRVIRFAAIAALADRLRGP